MKLTFWYRWPSWLTELLGGAALSLVLCFGLHFLLGPEATLGVATLAGTAVSVGYETFLDSNDTASHRPAVDIAQRACGQVLGLLVWALLP